MDVKPTNRKWILWMLNEFRPAEGEVSSKPAARSFETIVRTVRSWDEDVKKLFAYAGLNYRDAGHWYQLMGLLAELVAPDAIREPQKTGRKKFWTEAECKMLLKRHDEYKVRYPKRSSEELFVRMQKDQPLWYPLRPEGVNYDKSIQELCREKARTLARKRRTLIRLGHAGTASRRLK